jgi:hypothetical protein
MEDDWMTPLDEAILESVPGCCVKCGFIPAAHVGIKEVRGVGLVCGHCATCAFCSDDRPMENPVFYCKILQVYTHKDHGSQVHATQCYKCARVVVKWSSPMYVPVVTPGTQSILTELGDRILICTVCTSSCTSKRCKIRHKEHAWIHAEGGWAHFQCMHMPTNTVQ